MKFRLILFFVLGFFIFNNLTYTHAVPRHVDGDDYEMPDSTRRPNTDSIRQARERIADSIKTSRERIADSTQTARKHKTDSMTRARKRIVDSSAAIRKYHESKRYKDSLTRARDRKTKAVQKTRQAHLDSVKDARKSFTDSLAALRKAKTESIKTTQKKHTDSIKNAQKKRTDSIKTTQKKRTDSLARIAKYKGSKRYADSVTVAKHMRADSIAKVQKAQRDRMAGIRKKSLDSAKAVRKKSLDSMTAVRTKSLDSLKMVRKGKMDSLAKAKKLKENLAKSKETKKEESKKLQLELKIKQKHEAWSNAKMLKKKWGPLRRFTQNSFTHYNYYFNAKKKMDEAQVNMNRPRKENYDSLIGLYPFDPNRDSSLMSSDMDTIVRKISVGIQIHDPRVKWSNDLYLLLGQAYYYRGQYENASIAFRYIIAKDEEAKKKKRGKQGYSSSASSRKSGPSILEDNKKKGLFDFMKHKSVHNEAILWLARTYTQAGQVENAESILSLLESDVKLPNDLKGRMAIEKAFANLTDRNYPAAVKQLAIAVEDDNLPTWLRMRAAFLHGQLLQNMGDYKNAVKSFEQVLSYYPKIEMDFYSRKYVAFNKLEAGENIDEAMRPLRRVLNDGKYVSYYDQVYYVLGKLAVKANDNKQAITYLTKSTTTPRATRKQKALSFAALGDVYYANSNYGAAKRSYDSASKYSSGGKDASLIAAQQRSKGLEDVSGPVKVIHDQDSLLHLGSLSKKEQQSIVRRALRDYEKKQADSVTNALSSGVTTLAPIDAPEEPTKESASWYFGNMTLMQQGSAEFKRKWGNRPLTDNWRRSSALAMANIKTEPEEEEESLVSATVDNGAPTEEGMMARIPNTPQQKEQATKLQQKAYIQLAKAYVKQLEDYNMAIQTLDTLDMRYPNHSQMEEALYLRYQIALKQNKLDKAKYYSDQLLEKFPKSQYAANVRPKQSESKGDPTIGGKGVADYFDETYKLLMQHQYTEALMRIDAGKRQFDHPTYKKRFEVAEAMGHAGTGNFNQADTIITRFLRAYPADTLTPWATTVKEYIKDVRNGGKPRWYKDTPYKPRDSAMAKKDAIPEGPTAPAVKPSEPPPPSDIPSSYTYVPDTAHYCILVLPGVDKRTTGLKKAVRDLNAAKYPSTSFELLFDLYNIDEGVLLIRKFANVTEGKKYLGDLLASDVLKGYEPGEVKVQLISAPNYKKMFDDKDAEPYQGFYNANYK